MANTSLPVGLNTGNVDHIAHHNVIHETINKVSRDTGWRDASGLLRNGWKLQPLNSWIAIRRVDDLVYFSIRSLDGSDATSRIFMEFSTNPDSTRLSNWFSPGITQRSWQSATQVDDNGDPWVVRWYDSALQIPIFNYQRHLGTYARFFYWPVISQAQMEWPSFIPPAL